jgi:hypothetical protein
LQGLQRTSANYRKCLAEAATLLWERPLARNRPAAHQVKTLKDKFASAILAQTSLTAENRTLANARHTRMAKWHIKARPPQSASSSAAAPVAWKLAIAASLPHATLYAP